MKSKSGAPITSMPPSCTALRLACGASRVLVAATAVKTKRPAASPSRRLETRSLRAVGFRIMRKRDSERAYAHVTIAATWAAVRTSSANVLLCSTWSESASESSASTPAGGYDGPLPASGEKITYLEADYKVVRLRRTHQVFFWVDLIDFTR